MENKSAKVWFFAQCSLVRWITSAFSKTQWLYAGEVSIASILPMCREFKWNHQ